MSGALGLEVGRRDRGKWPIMVQPPSETTTRQTKLSFHSIHGGIFSSRPSFSVLSFSLSLLGVWMGHIHGQDIAEGNKMLSYYGVMLSSIVEK